MLLKHNLTVASDVMSACSSDEYSTPVEKEQDEKQIKEEIIEPEEPPCKWTQTFTIFDPQKINTLDYNSFFCLIV